LPPSQGEGGSASGTRSKISFYYFIFKNIWKWIDEIMAPILNWLQRCTVARCWFRNRTTLTWAIETVTNLVKCLTVSTLSSTVSIRTFLALKRPTFKHSSQYWIWYFLIFLEI
jgi:hypothetical protein